MCADEGLVAAAATAAAAVAATAAAEAARTLFTGASLIDDDGAAFQGLAVHAVDGSLGFGVRAHLDEAEAFGTASFAVHHDLGRSDIAELTESLLERVVTHRIGQIADVQFVSHGEPSEVPLENHAELNPA